MQNVKKKLKEVLEIQKKNINKLDCCTIALRKGPVNTEKNTINTRINKIEKEINNRNRHLGNHSRH